MSTAQDRMYRRAARITRRRPDAPRECEFDPNTNLLSWTEPRDASIVTHYRIRIGSDGDVPMYVVPVGQTTLQLTAGVTSAYVSSYNQTNDLECGPVPVTVQPSVAPTGVASIVQETLTAGAATPVSVAAPARDGLWLVVSLTQAAGAGGGWPTWGTSFSAGAPINVNPDADSKSLFTFVAMGGLWVLAGFTV